MANELAIHYLCVSPLSFLGTSGVILCFYFVLDEIPSSKQNSPLQDGTPRSAASHLRLYHLSMSHKKDARLM